VLIYTKYRHFETEECKDYKNAINVFMIVSSKYDCLIMLVTMKYDCLIMVTSKYTIGGTSPCGFSKKSK